MSYNLNDEQMRALTTPSPTYVNASAGAGKTRTLITKIFYLLDKGVDPKNILSITFTNKAAREMKSRLGDRVGGMQISTIHSMCVRIIRSFIRHTHLKLPFTIYDANDQISIIKTIVKSKELAGDPYDYLSTISRAKGDMTVPSDEDYLQVYEQYQEILKNNNACDFDDLLILAHQCLQQEDCRGYYSNLWKHILVDEFQDTSTLQYKIILSIYNPEITHTLFAVGDLNQSVYGWRQARPENVNDFIKNYNANVIYLTYNYRSCSEIITHANKFQQFGKPMVPKTPIKGMVSITEFENQQHEAESIVQAISRMGNYDGTAVIYRINTRSLLFEQAFTRYHIPYKVVNDIGFMNRRVTRDLLAALKASNNPSDRESLSRIINTPKRGFGDAKKEQLLLNGRSYVEDVGKEMDQIRVFLELLDDIKGRAPAEALEEYLNRSGYRSTLQKDSDRYMVEAVRDMVVQYNSVEELILASSFVEDDSKGGVNLLTAHASKGLEFDRVFVVGVENELWPHKNSMDIEEERRLYYVALTRAKAYLNISYSKSRLYRGTSLATYPSMLFNETFGHIS